MQGQPRLPTIALNKYEKKKKDIVHSISIEQYQGADVTNLPRGFIFGTVSGGLRPGIGYEVALQCICTCQVLQTFVEYEHHFRLVTYQKSYTDNR